VAAWGAELGGHAWGEMEGPPDGSLQRGQGGWQVAGPSLWNDPMRPRWKQYTNALMWKQSFWRMQYLFLMIIILLNFILHHCDNIFYFFY
jgi:hypothetical protein